MQISWTWGKIFSKKSEQNPLSIKMWKDMQMYKIVQNSDCLCVCLPFGGYKQWFNLTSNMYWGYENVHRYLMPEL